MKRICILLLLACAAVAASAQPKKVSVLGDSYSTFQGYNPDNYRNNSWGATTITGTGFFGRDVTPSCFLSRVFMLGDPDIIFVFGGTNDAWQRVPLGEYKYEGLTKADCMTFRPALAYLLETLKQLYPKAKVVSILNSELQEEVNESMREVCKHCDVQLVELHDIDKQNGHPSIAGMKSICEQLLEQVAD